MFKFFFSQLLILFSFLLGSLSGFATTIVPYAHLGEGIIASETVVLARALAAHDRFDVGRTYEDMEFQVLNSLKGSLTVSQNFFVRPYSCKMEDGSYWAVSGDFTPEAGRTYLLFLSQQGDFFRPNMLSYYVFEERMRQGDDILIPVAGTQDFIAFPRPDGVIPESLRSYKKATLLQMLSDYNTGAAKQWKGDDAALKYRFQPVQDRALPSGCTVIAGSLLARWQNQNITIKYDQNYTYTTPGVNVNTLLSNHVIPELNAAYPGINPTNGGTITSTSAPYSPCPLAYSTIPTQEIWILAEDPCNSIANLSAGCSGTYGIGGGQYYTPGHTFKGETWATIWKGRVEINNGINCVSSLNILKYLYEHEITHAFGIGHLAPSTENMYAFCCNPINTLDMTCMNYMYDAAAPVEITRFDVKEKGDRVAEVSWQSATESNNLHYTIERSADGVVFEAVGKVEAKGAGHYTWVDHKALQGINYYRLSQTDLNGTTTQVGIKSIRFAGSAVNMILWPNPAKGNTQMIITTETPIDGHLAVTALDGRRVFEQGMSIEAGRWQSELPLENLPAGQYRVTLTASTGLWHQVLVKQ
jgi:hypothetical protein